MNDMYYLDVEDQKSLFLLCSLLSVILTFRCRHLFSATSRRLMSTTSCGLLTCLSRIDWRRSLGYLCWLHNWSGACIHLPYYHELGPHIFLLQNGPNPPHICRWSEDQHLSREHRPWDQIWDHQWDMAYVGTFARHNEMMGWYLITFLSGICLYLETYTQVWRWMSLPFLWLSHQNNFSIHGILQEASKSRERNRIVLEISSSFSWELFQVDFFWPNCTFPENDWFFDEVPS